MRFAPALTADRTQHPRLDRVPRLWRRSWTAYWARRAERATIAVLQSLDDRALKDIGMDRSEIESKVHHARDRRVGKRRPATAADPEVAQRQIGMCV